MKVTITLAFLVTTFCYAEAQSTSMAQSLGMYVFPANDQTPDQQSKDDYDCYNWAKQQTGLDPMNMPDVQAQPTSQGHDGTVVRTAGRQAAMGAAIGAIAGDAGKGAAIGAATGGFTGLARRGSQNAAEEQNAEAAASQQEAANMNSFKKAFTVCLEGKGYTVE